MLWLTVTTLSYFLLALSFLADKYLLAGRIQSPRLYTFYIGLAGILVLALAPFVGFTIPDPEQILLALACGFFFILGLFWLYKALYLFEASRVMPAAGGMTPFFSALLVFIFSGGKATLTNSEYLAVALLILGSILITYQKSQKISAKCFLISCFAAILLAFYFVSAKYVYLGQPFWSGLIWIRIGGFLTVLFFLFSAEVRKQIFAPKSGPKKQGATAVLFFGNQAVGAGGNLLQSWAVALSPLVYVTVINALSGVQYVFLFIFSIILSLKFPRVLKEDVSRKIIIQKITAIILISGGMALFTLK